MIQFYLNYFRFKLFRYIYFKFKKLNFLEYYYKFDLHFYDNLQKLDFKTVNYNKVMDKNK